MNRLTALIKLKGNSKKDNYLIQKEKIKYLFNRTFREFIDIPYFTMGESLSRDVVAKNSYGLFLCRKYTYDLHIISDSYEFDVGVLLTSILKKSKVFVDIGANIGKYSILASKLNPNARIFAIEPSKENNVILMKNKNMNKIRNLKIKKLALNDKKGDVKLYLASKNKGGHSLKKIHPGKFEIVNGDTFDNLFSKELDIIDLVKIDAEGNEFKILIGMNKFLSERKIKNILIEINDKETKVLLETYGYSLRNIQYNDYLATPD
jgi:FkbM family methyltransferase